VELRPGPRWVRETKPGRLGLEPDRRRSIPPPVRRFRVRDVREGALLRHGCRSAPELLSSEDASSVARGATTHPGSVEHASGAPAPAVSNPYGLATMRDWAASELDPSLGKDATLKEVLDSGALGKEGPDAPESLSAKRRKKKGE
jgi:hypothetical protein